METAMTVCPACGAENPDGFKFCGQCASPLAAPPPIAEERKIVTTLFCDLVGSTALGEAADPEDVDALMRRYNAVARRVVESFGGTVEKFIGDAVVAVFGVPTVHEDDPERAVRAGLRLVAAMEELPGIAGRPVQIRVGVNTGEALVRLDVTPGSGEGFLTGDAVNTAARLQAAAPPMAVVAGTLTRDLTRRSIDYESLPPVGAKGKAAPVSCWRATATRARTGIDPRRTFPTPFVGRDTELASLTALFEKTVATSSPQVALLVGEPGVGKSRLVAELFRYVDERPGLVRWRQGACPSYGDGVTFWALGEIVRAHAGILDSDHQETAAAKLDEVVADGPDADWIRSRLRPLVGLQAPDGGREENFAAWLRFFEGLAEGMPTVLVVDDLHWADDALLAFLEHVAVHVADVPLLLIGTARPELLEHGPGLAVAPRVNRVALQPLTGADSVRLVRGLVDAGGVPSELVDGVVKRAQGNPFYAEECVLLLRDRVLDGTIGTQGGGSGAPAAEPIGAPLPASVNAVIAARLDALPPETKMVLGDAAVVGEAFWAGALAALGGAECDRLDRALGELIARQLVRQSRTSSMEGDQEFSFAHALARDVAYQQLPRRARLDKHRRAAEWIETRAADRVQQYAEILAHHYATALDLARALEDDRAGELSALAGRWLSAAAERALGLDAAAARHFAGRALDLLPADAGERAKIHYLRGKAESLAGDPGRALDDFHIAGQLFEVTGDRNAAACAKTELANWGISLLRADWQAALSEAVDLFDFERPTPDLVHALQETAVIRAYTLRDHEGAIQAANDALAVAEQIGAPVPFEAYEWRGFARAGAGDPGWPDDFERAMAEGVAQGATSLDMARLSHNVACVVDAQQGPLAGLEAFRRNRRFFEQRRMGTWELCARCREVHELHGSGQWEAAHAELDEITGPALASEWGDLREMVDCERALAAHDAGVAWSAAEAEAVLTRLIDYSSSAVLAPKAATALLMAAEMEVARDHRDEAMKLLARCLGGAGLPWGVDADGVVAMLPRAVRLGLRLGTVELAAEALRIAPRTTTIDAHGAVSAEALLAEARGGDEAAAAGFAAAAARWHDFGIPFEEAQALFGQGRCLTALGRAPEAAPVLEGARTIFARLGAAPALRETDVLLVGLE
jgi:class 3 adenylate cyclase